MLVHCNAGRGRSVVVTLAYLLLKHKQDGWDRYTALEVVQKIRNIAPLKSCCETRPQWRVLSAFEQRLHTRPGYPYTEDSKEAPSHSGGGALATDTATSLTPATAADASVAGQEAGGESGALRAPTSHVATHAATPTPHIPHTQTAVPHRLGDASVSVLMPFEPSPSPAKPQRLAFRSAHGAQDEGDDVELGGVPLPMFSEEPDVPSAGRYINHGNGNRGNAEDGHGVGRASRASVSQIHLHHSLTPSSNLGSNLGSSSSSPRSARQAARLDTMPSARPLLVEAPTTLHTLLPGTPSHAAPGT